MSKMPRWTNRSHLKPFERELHDMAVRVEAMGANPFLTDVSQRLIGARDRMVLWNDAGRPGENPNMIFPQLVSPTAVLSYIDMFAGQENEPQEVVDFAQAASRAVDEGQTYAELVTRHPDMAEFVKWAGEQEVAG